MRTPGGTVGRSGRAGARGIARSAATAFTLCALMLAAACAPPPHPLVRGADGPLPVRFDVNLWLEAGGFGTTTSPPGANDFECRPSAEHPRPVVLVHGLLLSQAFWQTLSPLLANNGYCVFALTYGAPQKHPGFGGLAPMERSSQELAAFVEEILAATGANQVDLIGHSEGTVMPQYWLKRLGGAPRVHTYIALTPLYDGTTGWFLDTLVKELIALPLGIGDLLRDLLDDVCGACRQVLHDSGFLRDLYSDGSAAPGVEYVTIMSRYDELITPYTSGFLDGATNIVLQDGCDADLSEHVSLPFSPRSAGFVLNALDPQHAIPPPCVVALPILGLPG